MLKPLKHIYFTDCYHQGCLLLEHYFGLNMERRKSQRKKDRKKTDRKKSEGKHLDDKDA